MSREQFTQSRDQILGVHTVRLGFYLLLLISFFLIQSVYVQFTSDELAIPWLSLVALALLVQAGLFIFFEKLYTFSVIHAGLFLFDIVFTTLFLAATGVKHTTLFFCYLLTIILTGFVFGRRGAMAISTIAAAGFLALLFTNDSVRGQSAILLMMFNVFAFLIVGYMAGSLSEQLNFMGFDVERLTDLNELIVGNVGTGLMTLNLQGDLLQMNGAALRILEHEQGFTPDLSVDKIWPHFLTALKTNLVQNSSSRLARFELSFSGAREEKICSCVASELKKQERPFGYVILFEDITQSKRVEMSLRQHEKLAAVGALASGIAHEIRNPLASISGSVQLLQSTLPASNEDSHRLMKISIKEIDRLNGLITEFLEYVKPESVPGGRVDLSQLLQDLAEMVRLNKSVRSDVAQSLEIERGVVVAGDADKLKQAFLNILINAYQALEKVEAMPNVFIGLRTSQGKVLVTIRDNGSGMDEKTLNRLFEPFHTTKPRGTGLGLAVTRKIFQSHGAEVLVKSQSGRGAEFIIEFPQLPLESGIAKMEKGRAS